MVGVRFELKTNDPWSVDDAICEALVRWATDKMLTNRLPKLSLITLRRVLVSDSPGASAPSRLRRVRLRSTGEGRWRIFCPSPPGLVDDVG